jgi:ornithine cyclodeaminase
MRHYSADEVREALPMSDAIQAMRVAFGELSAGRVQMPQRTVLSSEGGNMTLVMSGRCDIRYGLGAKIVSAFPGNRERGKATIHALMVLLDDETGEPVALMDGESLTAIRTGAASGLATDLLARRDAASVAIIGAGVQARTQFEAMCCVRHIERAVICSRSGASAAIMAEEVRKAGWFRGEVAVGNSISDAVRDSDIVCTATTSEKPLVMRSDLRPGTHVNAVGSFTPDMVEIDPQLIGSAYVVVDYRPAAMAEAGELVVAWQEGLLDPRTVVEIGEILNGTAVSAPSDEDTTVFESVGVAVQDLVAAARILSH